MKTSRNSRAGQPTGPKAPARSMSAKPLPRPSNPPKGGARRGGLREFLAQLDQLAAAVEADTNDRDACAVAVAVRELVKLARQPAPEGTRLTPTRTADGAGLRWHPQKATPSEPPALTPTHSSLVRLVIALMHGLAGAQDRAAALQGQLREACNDCDDPILLEASDLVGLLSLDLVAIGHDAVACSAELTGCAEGARSQSLLSAALDLHDLSQGTLASRREASEMLAVYKTRQRIAATHFHRT